MKLEISLLKLVLWAGITLQLFTACGDSKTNTTAVVPASEPYAESQRLAAEIEECKSTIEAKLSRAKEFVAKKMYWDATLTVRNCALALNDESLLKFARDNEIQSYFVDFNMPTASEAQINAAYLWLKENAPEKEAELQKMLPIRLAAADKAAKAIEAAEIKKLASEKRRRGVSIGMSKEDVLASSWGRPASVNRTSTQYGTQEQWVYGDGNYLYFKNGVLTAIQN